MTWYTKFGRVYKIENCRSLMYQWLSILRFRYKAYFASLAEYRLAGLKTFIMKLTVVIRGIYISLYLLYHLYTN